MPKKTVAKKVIKSTELEQAKVDFANFLQKVRKEYEILEVEIVVKSDY